MKTQPIQQFEDCGGYSVSWGGGLDSSAILAQMVINGFKPDAIVFAETGHEWPETYEAIDRISAFLTSRGYPEPARVHRCEEINVQRIEDLGMECLRSHTLPSVAYGRHKCSIKFKPDVINAHLKKCDWVQRVWRTPHHYDQTPNWITPKLEVVKAWAKTQNGNLAHCDPLDPLYAEILQKWRSEHPYNGFKRIVKLIGYDIDETRRAKDRFGDPKEQGQYEPYYPLRDWGFNRHMCAKVCKYVFGFAPKKSACVFCPHATDEEWTLLQEKHPHLMELCLAIEALAQPNVKKPDVAGLRRRGKKGERQLINWYQKQRWLLPESIRTILKAGLKGRNPRRLSKEERDAGAIQEEGIEVIWEPEGRIIVVDGFEAEEVRRSRQKKLKEKICK